MVLSVLRHISLPLTITRKFSSHDETIDRPTQRSQRMEQQLNQVEQTEHDQGTKRATSATVRRKGATKPNDTATLEPDELAELFGVSLTDAFVIGPKCLPAEFVRQRRSLRVG